MKQLTTREAAKRLGLTRARINQLIRSGYIKAKRFGQVYQIAEEDLAAAKWNRKPGPKGPFDE
jgi:excisionase family DNA binding protein